MLATKPMTLTKLQWLQVFAGHWELVFNLGQAAEQLANPAIDTMVKRWQILRAAGDQLAPELDDILSQLHAGKMLTTQSTMLSEADVEERFLENLRTTYIQVHVQQARQGLILAADASEDEKKKHLEAQTQAANQAANGAATRARRFDGHWLNAAIELTKVLAPIFGPLILKGAMGAAGL